MATQTIKAREIEKDGVKLIDYFDEHWYEISDELILPSVTSIIGKVIAKGFAFEEWLRNTGQESKKITREAAESGSKIHNAIEDLLKGNVINAMSGYFTKDEWRKLVNFQRWYEELSIECIESEAIIFDEELGYAGTIDFIGWIINPKTKEREKWLLDWKSGNAIHKEAYQQVAGYMNAYNKREENKAEPIKKCGVVHLGASNRTQKDYNNIGVSLTPVDFNESFEAFSLTLQLYKLLFPNEQAPVSEFPMEIKLHKQVLKLAS
jgi:hypothetical protein